MKGQAQIIGFTLLTLIMLSITALVFFWANPLIERSNNINELARMDANLRMLDDAIHEVATQQTQRSINFNIDKGFLRVKNNATIEFTSIMDLPSIIGEEIVVKGYNKTSGGSCLNTSRIGIVGVDTSSCITKKGAIIYQIYYPILNDTVNNECVGIRLGFGGNTGAGKGEHSILLTYDHSNITAEGSCPNINKPTVKIDIT